MPTKNITSVSGTSKEKRKTKQECKYCGQIIESDSIFCRFCGERLAKKKRTTEKKPETKVPKPRKRGDKWNIWLDKEQVSVTEDTEQLCIEKARAIRSGFIQALKNRKLTLRDACQEYIDKRDKLLSESTLYNYQQIVDGRFQAYMDKEITAIDWQKMVTEEQFTRKPTKKDIEEHRTPKKLSGKTIANAWGFVASVLDEQSIPYKTPTMPQQIKRETLWLEEEKQVFTFLNAVKGKDCEIGALLALHSLRRSEIFNISPNLMQWNAAKNRYEIHVEGAVVRGRKKSKTKQETNKTSKSRRVVPVLIPRLQELIENSIKEKDEPYVDCGLNTLYNQINSVCKTAKLPLVGVHGLRRTFATICFFGKDAEGNPLDITEEECAELGGWDDLRTLHECYVKLSSKRKESAVQKLTGYYSKS